MFFHMSYYKRWENRFDDLLLESYAIHFRKRFYDKTVILISDYFFFMTIRADGIISLMLCRFSDTESV